MQAATWKQLLQIIPRPKYDQLMLLTSAGAEVAIQNVLRMEDEYLVVRGRLAGTSDANRVFFVPFDQINYLGFQRELKEADIEAMFGPAALEGGGAAPAPAAAGPEAPAAEADPTPEVVAADAAEGDPEEGGPAPVRPGGSSPGTAKVANPAELLERIKNRSSQGQPRRPPAHGRKS
jgi:hypothetical protein